MSPDTGFGHKKVLQIKIWAKYDTRKLRDNHSFGIVTAFRAAITSA
jgi:hypothetical protein